MDGASFVRTRSRTRRRSSAIEVKLGLRRCEVFVMLSCRFRYSSPNCHSVETNAVQNPPRRNFQQFGEAVAMLPTDRRAFLRFLSSAAVTAALPASIERALAIPAHHRSGTIEDVEHIVFLMQENRAFDHYFGTLRGVRGYGDPDPASMPPGRPRG